MAISKLILNGTTQMDLTQDTVDASDLLYGETAHGADGETVTGIIATKSSSDMTTSGPTVTAPAGYYASDTSKTVAAGTQGTPSATKGTVSNHSVSVTPSVTNTVGYISGGTKTGTAVTVSASELVSGTKSISSNGTGIDVTNYASVNVAVPNSYTSADEGKVISDGALVEQTSRTISAGGTYDTTTNNEVVVPTGSATTPATSITPSISIALNPMTGYVGVSVSGSKSITPTVSEGYVVSGTAGTVSVSASGGHPLNTQAGTTITPTESQQTAVAEGRFTTGAVLVDAIPSDYIGSDIDLMDDTDLTVSGATVTAPAGYYAESASKTVASGSATTPATTITANPSISVNSTTGLITATASASKSVSPTVSAGYVSTGTAGTVTVSGSNTSQLSTQAGKTVTPTESQQTAVAAGKYTTGAVLVDAIPSDYVGSDITERDSTDLTVSGATVSVPAGYYESAASKSVASGSVRTPDIIATTTPTISVNSSTGLITASTSWSDTVTPTVSAGYISSGTAGTISVSGSGTSQLTTQAAQTITPTTTAQTIAAGKYLTGAQTVEAIVTDNLLAQYIKSGVTVKVGTASDDDSVASVTGTAASTVSGEVLTVAFGTTSGEVLNLG